MRNLSLILFVKVNNNKLGKGCKTYSFLTFLKSGVTFPLNVTPLLICLHSNQSTCTPRPFACTQTSLLALHSPLLAPKPICLQVGTTYLLKKSTNHTLMAQSNADCLPYLACQTQKKCLEGFYILLSKNLFKI